MASRSVLVNGNRAATFLTAPEPARVGAVSCSQVRGRASRYQSRAIGMLDGGEAASSGKTLRILLVDDSPADRELVKRAFREPAPPTGPLDLEVVTDAEAALTAVRKATFAVILTDYSLPGRNGLELLRALRETGDKTPVVMMTGLGDESVAVAALQHGAADYVIKEIGFERALPVVIDRVLGKRTSRWKSSAGSGRSRSMPSSPSVRWRTRPSRCGGPCRSPRHSGASAGRWPRRVS